MSILKPNKEKITMNKVDLRNLKLSVEEDCCYYNIKNEKTNDIVVGSEGIYPENEVLAHLFAAAPDLLDALCYAKRFLKKNEDVDMDYIDSVIAKAVLKTDDK